MREKTHIQLENGEAVYKDKGVFQKDKDFLYTQSQCWYNDFVMIKTLRNEFDKSDAVFSLSAFYLCQPTFWTWVDRYNEPIDKFSVECFRMKK